MKIQVDTYTKTIKVEKEVNLFEFMEFIKKIFPDGEWTEYKLSTETIINWFYPIVYKDYPTWIVNPSNPFVGYSGSETLINGSINGVYNIEA